MSRKVKHKGKLKNVDQMSKEELGEYLMKAKPSHEGYGKVAREYVRRRKK